MIKRGFLKRHAAAVFIILALAFLALTFLVANGWTVGVDLAITEAVQNFTSPTLTLAMVLVSFFGDGFVPLIVFLALAILLLFTGHKKEAYFLVLVWIAPILSWILKILVARPRPEGYLQPNYALPADFSFPSGHVLFYTALLGLIGFYVLVSPGLKTGVKILLLLFVLALIPLVGVSRIYLGVHWPTDVLAGYLLGFIVLEAIIFTYLKAKFVTKSAEQTE